MVNVFMSNAFEYADNFLVEARSKAYIKYAARVLEAKNCLHAKKIFQGQALLVLERFGA
jgi:hypothetical protein